MTKAILCLLVLMVVSGAAIADQYVSGYMRPNGTYVQPYYRSTPNSNVFDNYSTKGNINPYTGQKGYEDPYKPLLPSTSAPLQNYHYNKFNGPAGLKACQNRRFEAGHRVVGGPENV